MRVIEVIRRGRKGADGQSNIIGVETVSGTRLMANEDSGKAIRATAASTLTLPPTVGAGWSVIVDASDGDTTLTSTADINSAGSDITITTGNAALIYSDGTQYFVRFYVNSALTTLNATAVGFTPITGNAATDVDGAIGNLTALWNAVTAYGKSLIAAADAAAARTVLALGTAATRAAEDTLTNGANLPDGEAITTFVNTKIANHEWSFLAPQDTTSGTVFDLTGIPAGVNQVVVLFKGTSLDGTDNYIVQLEDSGGLVTTGYDSRSSMDGVSNLLSTSGFIVASGGDARNIVATMDLFYDGSDWVASHKGGEDGIGRMLAGGGFVPLANDLTTIRVTRTGTDNFDAGEIVVGYRK